LASAPFDKYYVNLVFAIPFNTAKPEVDTNSSKRVEPSWEINQSANKSKVLSSNETRIYGVDKNFTGKYNIYIPFQKTGTNTTIASITVPLLAVFFLLGAIFILERFAGIDQLTMKVTMTLGIFAFLFTFTTILANTEPKVLIDHSIPSVADSLIAIILIATIAFTVSSVASYAVAVRNKQYSLGRPRLLPWIDAFAFFL
jgi:hypothetical protein